MPSEPRITTPRKETGPGAIGSGRVHSTRNLTAQSWLRLLAWPAVTGMVILGFQGLSWRGESLSAPEQGGSAIALLVMGICTARMGGRWQVGAPLLLVAGSFIAFMGARMGHGTGLAAWMSVAGVAMAGMLIVLERPHSVPSAIAAMTLVGASLGLGLGSENSGAVLIRQGASLHESLSGGMRVLTAAFVYAGGWITGHHAWKSVHADRRFTWLGVCVCLSALAEGLCQATALAIL